jgi:hypothetical protein
LLDLVENECEEYNSKPFEESNWKEFTNVMNGNFSNDATKFEASSKQVEQNEKDLWSKE